MISNMGRNLQRYYDEAILKGRKEGKKEGKLETALSLLRMKLNADLVAEATGLPLEEIEKLQQKL
jgi:predicted transposase/invertase (TIGR01784 family)